MVILVRFIFSILIFLVGGISFVSFRKHLLNILLRLEFIVLSLFFILVILLTLYEYEIYIRILFLTFSVCEGALGLSLLVSIIRTHGNDYFQRFSILIC